MYFCLLRSLLQGPRLCQATVKGFHAKILPPYGPVPVVRREQQKHGAATEASVSRNGNGDDEDDEGHGGDATAAVLLVVRLDKFERILGRLADLIALNPDEQKASISRVVC